MSPVAVKEISSPSSEYFFIYFLNYEKLSIFEFVFHLNLPMTFLKISLNVFDAKRQTRFVYVATQLFSSFFLLSNPIEIFLFAYFFE